MQAKILSPCKLAKNYLNWQYIIQ